MQRELANVAWIDIKTVEISIPVAAWNLGDGESAVISWAIAEPDYMAIVDDFAARRCAKVFGIKTLGTGGLLVLAKRRGLIKSVNSQVQMLLNAGLYLSASIIQSLLREADE